VNDSGDGFAVYADKGVDAVTRPEALELPPEDLLIEVLLGFDIVRQQFGSNPPALDMNICGRFAYGRPTRPGRRTSLGQDEQRRGQPQDSHKDSFHPKDSLCYSRMMRREELPFDRKRYAQTTRRAGIVSNTSVQVKNRRGFIPTDLRGYHT
jgi:hypothetical protein